VYFFPEGKRNEPEDSMSLKFLRIENSDYQTLVIGAKNFFKILAEILGWYSYLNVFLHPLKNGRRYRELAKFICMLKQI